MRADGSNIKNISQITHLTTNNLKTKTYNSPLQFGQIQLGKMFRFWYGESERGQFEEKKTKEGPGVGFSSKDYENKSLVKFHAMFSFSATLTRWQTVQWRQKYNPLLSKYKELASPGYQLIGERVVRLLFVLRNFQWSQVLLLHS